LDKLGRFGYACLVGVAEGAPRKADGQMGTQGVARIEYTKETRRGEAVRRAKEVAIDKVERTLEKLTNEGAYNFDVKYELAGAS
jgi:hypothetical protein